MPGINKYELSDYSPLVPAEDVPLPILQDLIRGKTGNLRMTGLVEIAINTGDRAYLDDAQEVMEDMIDDPNSGGSAVLASAFVPMFEARIERRNPTDQEIASTIDNLRSSLSMYDDLIGAPDAKLEPFASPAYPQAYKVRGYMQATLGEGLAAIIANENALKDLHDPVYPSSKREDGLERNRGMQQLYGNTVHDLHTFNADHPSERTTFNVKTRRKVRNPVPEATPQIRILQLATQAAKTVLQDEGNGEENALRQLSITDVTDIAQSTEGPAPHNRYANAVYQKMSEYIGHIISRAAPVHDDLF